jgi:hypothetical protein
MSTKMPTFSVETAFGCFSKNHPEDFETDLLVLTMLAKMPFPSALNRLDAQLDGLLESDVVTHGFTAGLGEHRLFDLRKHGLPPKYVLLVGLGAKETFNTKVVCGFFRLVIEVATKIGAKRVTIPFMPQRLTAESMNLRGNAAILRCRVHESWSQGKLTDLEEIQVICAPQAKRHIEAGLGVEHQLCKECRNPCIVED